MSFWKLLRQYLMFRWLFGSSSHDATSHTSSSGTDPYVDHNCYVNHDNYMDHDSDCDCDYDCDYDCDCDYDRHSHHGYSQSYDDLYDDLEDFDSFDSMDDDW